MRKLWFSVGEVRSKVRILTDPVRFEYKLYESVSGAARERFCTLTNCNWGSLSIRNSTHMSGSGMQT